MKNSSNVKKKSFSHYPTNLFTLSPTHAHKQIYTIPHMGKGPKTQK